MDRNTVIGALLILAMLLAYQFLAPTPPPEPARQQKQTTATTSKATAAIPEQALADSAAMTGPAQDIVLENPDLRLTLSTQGGRVKQVFLKKYKTYDQQPLLLQRPGTSVQQLQLPVGGRLTDVSNLPFTPTRQGNTVRFTATVPGGGQVSQTYTLPAAGYEVGYLLAASGFQGEAARLSWRHEVEPTEKDLNKLRSESTVNFYTASDAFENLSPSGSGLEEEAPEEPLKWVSFKQMYFVSGLIPRQTTLQKAQLKTTAYPEDDRRLKTLEASVQVPLADLATGKGQFTWFFGPNDFETVNKVADGFNRNVDLGYAFVRPINRLVFVPMFQFLGKFITNYGLLIVVLVLIIKLALTPLTYKSYVSMAKMRVMQPELAALKEKIGDDDPAKMQQEQMKLYQQVGINPLSGCIPQLLTLPILMSVFFLFPNLIDLRQQPFLWSNDLSTYDDLIKFGFKVPLLGNHISLFTLLMTASSLAFAWYNNQTTPAAPGPVDMKMLGYIMPLVFFFVMNSFPAGLAWYYFVSNIVTIGQQQIIKRFVDEDRIKNVLEDNRRKMATGERKKSKFSEILDRQMKAAQEAQRQAGDARNGRIDSDKKKK